MVNQTTKSKRRRRTAAELFLDALKKASGSEQKLISNNALRAVLGWDDGKYKTVKKQLQTQKAIIVGAGYGGSVGLSDAPGEVAQNSLKIFISYSHSDETIKNDLIKHLEPLKRLGLIEVWHDSIDFINSKYCYDVEMIEALSKYARGESTIIPIIVRNCLWSSAPFSDHLALPTDGRAISTWSDKDEALTNVADGIKRTAERILSTK